MVPIDYKILASLHDKWKFKIPVPRQLLSLVSFG